MVAQEILNDIRKGYVFWKFCTGRTCNSKEQPEEMQFVCECVRTGCYRELVRSSHLYTRACFYFGLITQEEMEDWEYGGIIPAEEKLPKMLIMCFNDDYRNSTIVCAHAWYRKQNREPNEAPLLIC